MVLLRCPCERSAYIGLQWMLSQRRSADSVFLAPIYNYTAYSCISIIIPIYLNDFLHLTITLAYDWNNFSVSPFVKYVLWWHNCNFNSFSI